MIDLSPELREELIREYRKSIEPRMKLRADALQRAKNEEAFLELYEGELGQIVEWLDGELHFQPMTTAVEIEFVEFQMRVMEECCKAMGVPKEVLRGSDSL